MIAKAGDRTVFALNGVMSVVVLSTAVCIKSAMFWSDRKEIDEITSLESTLRLF